MARNRQRAKQRQAERRAKRLSEQRDGDAQLIDDSTAVDPSPAVPPELAVGAPPTDEGRSDNIFGDQVAPVQDRDELTQDELGLSEDEALQEIEDWEVEDEDAEATTGEPARPATRSAAGAGATTPRRTRTGPRVIQFLIAVWAELQRVQWPNRQALVTLTGVVLGFVLIAGGYLGLLDAIFSELIKAIL